MRIWMFSQDVFRRMYSDDVLCCGCDRRNRVVEKDFILRRIL